MGELACVRYRYGVARPLWGKISPQCGTYVGQGQKVVRGTAGLLRPLGICAMWRKWPVEQIGPWLSGQNQDRLAFEPIKVSMSRRASLQRRCRLLLPEDPRLQQRAAGGLRGAGMGCLRPRSTQANVCISPGRRCQQRRRAALLTARNPVLRHAIVAIVQMDRLFEAARMD